MDAIPRPELIAWGLSMATLFIGGVLELRTGHIPNWLTLPAAAGTLVVGVFGLPTLRHVISLVITLVVYSMLFRKKVIGGGAVKLASAVAGLGGLSIGLGVVAVVFLGSGLLVLAPEEWSARVGPTPGVVLVFVGWTLGVTERMAMHLELVPW